MSHSESDSRIVPPVILMSYFPSKNAKADDHDLFGFMTLRAVCQSEAEAIDRAKAISKKDSQGLIIHHLELNKVYPICATAKRSKTIDYATMRREEASSRAAFDAIHQGKAQETTREVEERIRKLQTEGDGLDELDRYITTRVKLAELSGTLERVLYRMPQVIDEARKQETPDVLTSYRQAYEKAVETVPVAPDIRKKVALSLDDFEAMYCKWKATAEGRGE